MGADTGLWWDSKCYLIVGIFAFACCLGLSAIFSDTGSFEYETFCQLLRKRNGAWQAKDFNFRWEVVNQNVIKFSEGYLAELLHVQVDSSTVKAIFWLMKIAADYLFLRQPFIVPNLAKHLMLSKDDFRSIIQQNCQIREQIIHCFIKYYRRNKHMPSTHKEKLLFSVKIQLEK